MINFISELYNFCTKKPLLTLIRLVCAVIPFPLDRNELSTDASNINENGKYFTVAQKQLFHFELIDAINADECNGFSCNKMNTPNDN